MTIPQAPARSTPLSEIPDQLAAEHQAVYAALGEAVSHALEAGRLLAEAREQVEHGQWAHWLKENFDGSDRTARDYMAMHVNRDKIEIGSALPESIREALRLIRPRPQLGMSAEDLRHQVKLLRELIDGNGPDDQTQLIVAYGRAKRALAHLEATGCDRLEPGTDHGLARFALAAA